MAKMLDDRMLGLVDAYWRASNYLTVGQIYLMANPLLREPLRPEHIKPRLLGHWGTSPGQNFVYVHLNRLIREHDANVIYISGPGHGGPSVMSHTYLEGTYSEIYPRISEDTEGMRLLFRQFSSPGGVPSHAGPHVPGSINEGGELGYSLVHAFGAAFDNPDLIVACVIGDGEAETGAARRRMEGRTVSQSGARRRGAADPSSERLQNFGSHRVRPRRRRRTRSRARRSRLRSPLCRGRRSAEDASRVRRDARPMLRDDSRDPDRCARKRAPEAADVARDRAANAQRMDRAEGRRRRADRRDVPRASGAARRA